MFIALLSFSGSLETKYVSLNNEPCMARHNFVNLIPAALNYYPIMFSIDKWKK